MSSRTTIWLLKTVVGAVVPALFGVIGYLYVQIGYLQEENHRQSQAINNLDNNIHSLVSDIANLQIQLGTLHTHEE